MPTELNSPGVRYRFECHVCGHKWFKDFEKVLSWRVYETCDWPSCTALVESKDNHAAKERWNARYRAALIAKLGMEPEDLSSAEERYAYTTGEFARDAAVEFGLDVVREIAEETAYE